jgi:hypothetical protein
MRTNAGVRHLLATRAQRLAVYQLKYSDHGTRRPWEYSHDQLACGLFKAVAWLQRTVNRFAAKAGFKKADLVINCVLPARR